MAKDTLEAPPGDTGPPSPDNESLLRSTFKALEERDYAWFFAGNLSFMLAITMQFLLFALLAHDLTGSAKAVGAVAIANTLPAFLAPFSGALADRMDKRIMLTISQVVAIAATTTLAVLVIGEEVRLWHAILVSFVTGFVMVANMPTRQALVPQLVPRQKLMNAISLQMGQMNLSRIIAPSIAGLLVAPLGLGWVFLVSSGLFFGSMLLETRLPKHGMRGHQGSASLLSDVREGFRYVLDNKTLQLLLLANILIPMFGFPVVQLLPVFAREEYGQSDAGIGLMVATGGIGGLIGALIAANMDRQAQKGRLMFVGGATMGSLYLAFALTPSYIVSLPLLALAAAGQMLFMTTNSTVIQSIILPEVRGRVMAIMGLSIGLTAAAIFPVAVAVDEVGPRAAIAATSVLVLSLLALLYWFSPSLRRLRIEAPRTTQLSPAQAAAKAADGSMSQDEADRLSGRHDLHQPGDAPAEAED